MNTAMRPISDAHIHAYVDNELNKERREFVEEYIITLPLKCRQVRSYRKINELMRHVYSVEKIPYKYQDSISTSSGAAHKFKLVHIQKSVILMGIVIGFISGWFVINLVSDELNYNSQLVNQFQLTPNQSVTQKNN